MESNEGRVVAAVPGVLKVAQEGFRKVALEKAARMEVSRWISYQGNNINKAWQQLLNAIAKALPSLKEDCRSNEDIKALIYLMVMYFLIFFLYFCSGARGSCYYTCTCTYNDPTLLGCDVSYTNNQVVLPSICITGHHDYSSTERVL